MKSGLYVNKDSLSKLQSLVQYNIDKLKETVVKRLCAVGESAVKIARERGNYEDRTGNLRSSIGYMVWLDGESVFEGGQVAITGKNGNGTDGISESQKVLEKLKSELPSTGAVLVVTAGMNYAWYVENLYHRDVLASAEIEAERLARKLLKLD